MSLPRYGTYRDSGTSWLGYVPSHWNIRRLGYFFEERRDKVSDKDFPPLSVTKHGIVPQLETAAKTDDGDNRKKVVTGDFVINSRSDRKGSSGAAFQDGSVSLINTVLRPVSGIDIGFAHHLLRSVPFQEEFYRYGKGIVADLWSTNYSEMRNIVLAVPEVGEQAAIAVFLDRETTKIDALIAEQEKLISLLVEKRQAIITYAVTKGLNPKAPMKDSGVTWMGEVPAHWKVNRVKDVARLESGHTPSKQSPEYWENCDIPWVSLNDSKFLATNDYISDTAVKINELGLSNSSARMLPSGAVVFTRDASIGLATITTLPMAVSQHLIAWCPSERITSLFLLRVFNAMKPHLDAHTFGATIKTIGMADVKKLMTAVPPIDEQLTITAHISVETSKVDALRSHAERAITLLKERRSALIAAAVTGRIDVRCAMSQVTGESPEAIAA